MRKTGAKGWKGRPRRLFFLLPIVPSRFALVVLCPQQKRETPEEEAVNYLHTSDHTFTFGFYYNLNGVGRKRSRGIY